MDKTPELIIFDCDGVLVDSERIFYQVMVDDLREYGFELDLQHSMAAFAGGSIQGVVSIAQASGIHLPENWVNNLYDKVLERLKQGVDAVEGIPELVAQLTSSGMPFCVASNGPKHKMELTLGHTGLLPYFENTLFSAYDIDSWKPEPELFLHAAKHFSVIPENCIVIEDSDTGTLAAKRAGMPCLGYAPEGHDEKLANNGARCFTTMDEVIGLIGLAKRR